jgi:hypothetical protein
MLREWIRGISYYEALIGRGKRPKQALVAVAHKLLRRLMGRLKAFYREKGVGGPGPPPARPSSP